MDQRYSRSIEDDLKPKAQYLTVKGRPDDLKTSRRRRLLSFDTVSSACDRPRYAPTFELLAGASCKRKVVRSIPRRSWIVAFKT